MYKGINILFVGLKTLQGNDGLIIQADIKYNGKKIATFRDDGNGGEVDINAIGRFDNVDGNYKASKTLKNNRELLLQLEAEFKNLPKVKCSYGDLSSDLDDCIDYAMDEFINNKALLKDAKKGLVFKDKLGSTSIMQWGRVSIATLIKNTTLPRVISILEKEITSIQNEGGEILMQDYYISLGVNPTIFTNQLKTQ